MSPHTPLPPSWVQRLRGALCVLVGLALGACGGGGSTLAEGGGVGSGGTGITYGTVSGFGSVVVDGVHFDDSKAEVQTEDLAAAEVRLGQTVAVTHDTQRTASRIEVRAQLRGPVSAIGSSTLSVAGYPVDVIDGGDTTRQATVIEDSEGNATELAALQGDVEVHGVWLTSSGGYRLAATRIEQLSGAAARVLVSGVVTQVAGASFALNGVGTVYQGSTTPLKDQYLALELERSRWSSTQGATYTSGVTVRSRSAEGQRGSAVAKTSIELSGTVLGINANRTALQLRGVRLNTLPNTLEACVQDGAYVEIKAKTLSKVAGLWIQEIRCVDAPSGETNSAIQAREGVVAQLSTAQRSFKLKNTALTVVWDEQTYFKNTTRTTLLNGAAVEVEGVIVGSTLRARKIKGK